MTFFYRLKLGVAALQALKNHNSPVFREHLIELRTRNKEQYRRDRVEALRPLLPLSALAADVDEHEGDIVDVDRAFRDALRRFPTV